MNKGHALQKRVTDVGVAGFMLWMSSPIILSAAVLVKLDSPGPAFYRSRRVGRGWKEFSLLKLRTMEVQQEAGTPQVTAGSDERITRVGRLLRKLKLDELPQFVNVLSGEMSLVGPRPEVMKYASRYRQDYDHVLSVKPGLTDRVTLANIDEESELADKPDPEAYYVEVILPRKIEMCRQYIDHQSMKEDLQILARTALKLLRRIARL